MAEVIARLKLDSAEHDRKIEQSKKKYKELEKGCADAGKALNDLAGKMGMSIPKLGALSLGLGAVAGALKVAKDAFKANESLMDEWESTIRASESVYSSFLNSLNTGNISGFLSRIGTIISKAKEAYKALDDLGTQKAINNAAYQSQNSENERMRAMLRTGRYIAPLDGRKGLMANGALLSKEQMDILRKQLENGQTKLNDIIVSEISSTNNAIETLYDQQAEELEMSLQQFKEGTKDWQTFQEKLAGYQKYLDFEAAHTSQTSSSSSVGTVYSNVRDSAVNPYAEYKGWGIFKDGGDLFKKINELINQRSGLMSASITQQTQMWKAIDKGGSGGGKGNGNGKTTEEIVAGTIADYQMQITALNKTILNATDQEARESALRMVERYTNEIKRMKGETSSIADMAMPDKPSFSTTDMSNLQLNPSGLKYAQEQQADKVARKELKAEGGKELKDGLMGITSGLKQLGVDFGEGFNNFIEKVQGVMTIIQGIQTVVSSFQLFSAANDTTQSALLSEIALNTAITAGGSWIPFFSNGGKIPRAANGYGYNGQIGGNSYSGDNQLIAVNAGEYVFNRAQLGNLASQLQGSAQKTQIIKVEIENNKLVGTLNNAEKRGLYTS